LELAFFTVELFDPLLQPADAVQHIAMATSSQMRGLLQTLDIALVASPSETPKHRHGHWSGGNCTGVPNSASRFAPRFLRRTGMRVVALCLH